MAIVKTTTLYEVLWRFGDDGTFKGAHARYVETISDTDTGEVLSVREAPPQPVAKADVAELMGQSLGDLAGQVTALTVERDDLAKQVAGVGAIT